jgi:hypothetical protein
MTKAQRVLISGNSDETQPFIISDLTAEQRDRLIVSYDWIDGKAIPLALYGDEQWPLAGGTTNQRKSVRKLDFRNIPSPYLDVMKAMVFRYKKHGLDGSKLPKTATLVNWLKSVRLFLKWLERMGITRLSTVSPLVCLQYVESQKQKVINKAGGQLKVGSLGVRFRAIETIYELSQHTNDPMPSRPWTDTTALQIAGALSLNSLSSSHTQLIPDDIFCKLFQSAWDLVQNGEHLLDMRDDLNRIELEHGALSSHSIGAHKNRYLVQQSWVGGLGVFGDSLVDLRTACYIIVASLSGCRNHELAYIDTDASL